MKTLTALFFVCLLFACNRDKQRGLPGNVSAYVPVYADKQAGSIITMESPQPIINGGKIAVSGHYLFQVEQDKGIHIINYANPKIPVKIAFIKNMLCRELTLKGNYIYTNNMRDLVVLDISDLSTVKITKRIENAFPDLGLQYPLENNCYFECADPGKGVVIGWELKTVNNPKCQK